MCSNTTALNTGKFSGACILLKALLNRLRLWIACRHHVLEDVLANVFKCISGSSTGPQNRVVQATEEL